MDNGKGHRMDKRKARVKWFEMGSEQAAAALAKFQERFSSDPLSALEWSDKAFRAAADRHVAVLVLHDLRRLDLSDDQLVEQARREVERRAQVMESSTSAPSNLVERHLLRAWGEALDKLKSMVEKS